jgi:hypothetical protein
MDGALMGAGSHKPIHMLVNDAEHEVISSILLKILSS